MRSAQMAPESDIHVYVMVWTVNRYEFWTNLCHILCGGALSLLHFEE
jgi:hypothetical protein